jgi:hypothetical protein
VNLSVLKSHFNLACSFVLNGCIVFCERRYVRTFDLQKGFSLLDAVNDGSGKRDGLGSEDLKSFSSTPFGLELAISRW